MIGIGKRAIDQGLGISLDGRQRRAQLVRHVDHEILADALQFLELGMLVLQLGNGLLQVLGGLVERLLELAELAGIGLRQARAEVAASQLAGVGHDGSQAP